VRASIKTFILDRLFAKLPTQRLCAIAGRLVTAIWPGFRDA
jgi:hypothetical protein